MLGVFYAKPHAIQRWAMQKGYSGTPYDAIYKYFRTNSSLSDGTLYDYIYYTLVSNGYAGTMQDMLAAFFEATTGIQGRIDSEKAFWDNSSYDFFGGVQAVKDDSGNIIYDDSGNIVKA